MAVPVGDSFGQVGALEANDEAAKRAWLAQTYAQLINSLGAMTNRRMAGDRDMWQRGFQERQLASQEKYNDRYFQERESQRIAGAAQKALLEADNGTFGSMEEIQRLFPDLSPPDAEPALRRSLEARRAMEDEYNQIKGAAEILNRRALIQGYIPKSEEVIREAPGGLFRFAARAAIPGTMGSEIARGPLGGDTVDFENRRIAGWKSELEQIAPIAARLEGNRNLMNALRIDPETGQFVPAVTAPSWMQSRSAAGAPPGGAPPATQPQMPPEFYNRVKDYLRAGLTLPEAKARAMQASPNAPPGFSRAGIMRNPPPSSMDPGMLREVGGGGQNLDPGIMRGPAASDPTVDELMRRMYLQSVPPPILDELPAGMIRY